MGMTIDFTELAEMISQKVTENIAENLKMFLGKTAPTISDPAPIKSSKIGRIKGNKGLAKEFGVDPKTVHNWKTSGILNEAILAEYGRTIIYDGDKVLACLKHRKVKSGRPKM